MIFIIITFYLLILQVMPLFGLKFLKTIFFFLFPQKKTAAGVIGLFPPSFSKRNLLNFFYRQILHRGFRGGMFYYCCLNLKLFKRASASLSHWSHTAWLPGHCITRSSGMPSLSRICTKSSPACSSNPSVMLGPPVPVDMLIFGVGKRLWGVCEGVTWRWGWVF